MPYLHIRTNQHVDDAQALINKASALCASMLGKPESYVMVALEADCTMSFAGSSAPLAYLELKSLGLPTAQARHYSRQLCDFISEQLNVPASRIYIEFSAGDRALWGFNGSTFA